MVISVDDVQVAFPLFQEGSGGSIPTSAHQRVYDKPHSWQYDIRLNNREEDLRLAGYEKSYTELLTTKDFSFLPITGGEERRLATVFIKRHEWLGNLSQYTTHWFGAYHNGILAGVILMNMPNAFSKLLGEDTRKMERLISRGACVSWSPPNLASKFLMWCCRWMVQTTDYRLFTAYSDPNAKELGTIYQACGFYYLGNKNGANTRYINPYTGKVVSDRFFRVRSAYKKYAKELGIVWVKNWNNDQRMLWENVPDDVEKQLRDFSKFRQSNSEKVITPAKHKYAYVLGKNKAETKELRAVFEGRNKVFEYPKVRGL
jgi:hypothetical protein